MGGFIVNKGRENCIPFEKFLYWIVAKGTLFFFFNLLTLRVTSIYLLLTTKISDSESFIKIMRIREMIAKLRSFHCS